MDVCSARCTSDKSCQVVEYEFVRRDVPAVFRGDGIPRCAAEQPEYDRRQDKAATVAIPESKVIGCAADDASCAVTPQICYRSKAWQQQLQPRSNFAAVS